MKNHYNTTEISYRNGHVTSRIDTFLVAHCAGHGRSPLGTWERSDAIAAEPCNDRREDGGDTRNRGYRLVMLRFLLYLLPAALFFSYHPIIPLGSTPSMNLELSLPLIWLAIFTLLSLPLFPYNLRSLSAYFPKKTRIPLIILLFSFPLYLTVSIFWSPNPLRATLTASILWCLILSILTIPNLIVKKNIKNKIVKIFLISSVVVSLFCWIQCILDIMNVPRDATLLCRGCIYHSFGFPHPNGFAIEPQFMGNLLLAPCFLSLYLLLSLKNPRQKFTSKRLTPPNLLDRLLTSKKSLLLITIFLVSTLFLTFSRGAIYAFLLGSTILIIVNLIRKKYKVLRSIPIIIVAFLLTLLAQGSFAQLSPTTDTFASGINKVISHLSLGHLSSNLDAETEQIETEGTSLDSAISGQHHEPPFAGGAERGSASPSADKSVATDLSNAPQERTVPDVAYFDGYVPESTEVRVSLANSALASWQDYKWFGSGLASSGTILYEKGFTGTPKEIIQNEYATLLLETGLVGCILLLVALAILTRYFFLKVPQPARSYLGALVLAYGATLFFFSGLPNALHIYLLPAIFFSFFPSNPNSSRSTTTK